MAFSSDPQEALNQFGRLIIDSLYEIGSDCSPSSGMIGIKWEDDFTKYFAKLYELGFRVDRKYETRLDGDDDPSEYYMFRAGIHDFIQVYIGSCGSDISDVTFVLDHYQGHYYHEDCCNTIKHIWLAIHDVCGRCGNIDNHGFEIWVINNVRVAIKKADWLVEDTEKSLMSLIRFINMYAKPHKSFLSPAQVADDDVIARDNKAKGNVSPFPVVDHPQQSALRSDESVPSDNADIASLRREVTELRELILSQTAKISSAEDNITSLMRSIFDGLKKEERIQEASAPHDEGDQFL